VVDNFALPGPEETARAGELLADLLVDGDLIGLVGDLGAGKTQLVQGLARGLGVPPERRVTSPTFALVNEYHGGRMPLIHADIYRIDKERELDELGLDEACRSEKGVVAIEWSDRFRVLPPDHLAIAIAVTGDNTRTLSASGGGPRSRELAAAWATKLSSAK
jgi:tRNA threonylcarbamoyladenosine biosynthesis protein TsaE